MERLCEKHKKLEQKFFKYQAKVRIDGQAFPLDYILNLPAELRNAELHSEVQQKAGRLREI